MADSLDSLRMVADGCIYGRFQPFHKQHLEDVKTALERSCFLWIGLAEPFPSEPSVKHPDFRLVRLANPLTYHERQFMITRTLVAEGVAPDQFSFTPFPISTPATLPQFLDLAITCFVTGNSKRNHQERAVLEKLGYPCDILRERDDAIEPASLRSLLLGEDDSWRDLVPSSVSYYLDEIDLPTRLRDLQD